MPGWDVELYRNGILLASLIVDDTGFYEFSDVELFGGENDFELFFYGPQGEIRNREIAFPVTSAFLSAQNNTYDISVSLNDTNSYRRRFDEDQDRETLHVAARYNKLIGNNLAYLGLRNRDIEGQNKTFFATGLTSFVAGTIIDANIGCLLYTSPSPRDS